MNTLIKNYSIIDTYIHKLSIYTENFKLIIDIECSLSYIKEHRLKLKFYNVQKYSFLWNSHYDFYYVTNYKFIESPTGVYLSLDPDETLEEMSETDNDFILSESVECYLLDS